MATLELIVTAPTKYQLMCPGCGGWLVEWTPAPGGSVRARCDVKGCRHHVRFTYDAEGCLHTAILPRDLFSRIRDWFVWMPLPLPDEGSRVVTYEGRQYRLTLTRLD